MRPSDSPNIDRNLARAERALAAIAGAVLVLGAVYVLGTTGLPGDAFVAVLDWAVGQGMVNADSPTMEAVLSAIA